MQHLRALQQDDTDPPETASTRGNTWNTRTPHEHESAEAAEYTRAAHEHESAEAAESTRAAHEHESAEAAYEQKRTHTSLNASREPIVKPARIDFWRDVLRSADTPFGTMQAACD